MNTYPEHEKMALIADKSQAIGEFLEWLWQEENMVIAEYGTDAPGDDRSEHRLYSVHRSPSDWLARYFQIDQVQLELEKRAMLDEMRKAFGDDD